MRINVAGAGAGKTASMADRVRRCEVPEGKVVYCVAFTNAAADNIRSRLGGQCGAAPKSIKVSTIHSFMYGEIIQPLYHLLFAERYRGVSAIDLSSCPQAFKAKRIKELESEGLLHVTAIPQRAKWVVAKRTGDTAGVRGMRRKALDLFSGWCHKIFVDEAQDMDAEMQAVFETLDEFGIDIELYGDPKQDVKGHGCFRRLIAASDEVTYEGACHRCPEKHLLLSNLLACDQERQFADPGNRAGGVRLFFESSTDARALMDREDYGLVYISRKNDRFDTHSRGDEEKRLATLRHEVARILRNHGKDDKTELETMREAHYVAEQMIAHVDAGATANATVGEWVRRGLFEYDRQTYARLCGALGTSLGSGGGKVEVQSVEKVKGLQDERCLFILTGDLAPYLFGDEGEDNKTKHLLYVALTRSLDDLSILVTREVEAKYTREYVLRFFEAVLLQ